MYFKNVVNDILVDRMAYIRAQPVNPATIRAVQVMYECTRLRDSATALHSNRVALYSYLLAKECDPDNAFEYLLGGLVHDAGKIAFPDPILKDGIKLSPEEKVVVQQHVRDSVTLLELLQLPRIIIDMARYHHERYDGSGYLEQLKGDEIPLIGRVTAIVDVYCAMTDEGRVYQRSRSHAEALELIQGDNVSFDPLIMKSFIKVINQYAAMNTDRIHSLAFVSFEKQAVGQ